MDTVPAQPAGIARPLPSVAPPAVGASAADAPLPEALTQELWQESGAGQFELSASEFAQVLFEVGSKHNFGLDAGTEAPIAQQEAFCRALRVRELALARACALGRENAWTQFIAQFRDPLTQAAIGLTRSASLGEDLADSLYSDLYGLTERAGVRWSPLATYSGRGSLMGWLRAMLAQRYVNHYRRTHRETPLEPMEVAAPTAAPQPEPHAVGRLAAAVTSALAALDPEDRFLLSAYYLDRHTLLELSRVLRVHEATVSRKLKRLTTDVRKQIRKTLESGGMSRRAAEEAMGSDPGDLDVNLRKLLQTPAASTFSGKEGGS